MKRPPRLGSRWWLRHGTRRERRRIAVVVRAPARRRLTYLFEQPLHRGPTMYRRPYTSTRTATVARFLARFVEV